MGVATIIFAILAMRYEYVDRDQGEAEAMKEEKPRKPSSISRLSVDDVYQWMAAENQASSYNKYFK